MIKGAFFAAFLLSAITHAEVAPIGIRFEDLVERSQTILFAPLVAMEFAQEPETQLIRFSTAPGGISFKGGIVPGIISVRAATFIPWEKKKTVVDAKGQWVLLFLKNGQNGVYEPTSQNPFQNGVLFQLKSIPIAKSATNFVIDIFNSGTERDKLSILQLIDRTDQPDLLNALRSLKSKSSDSVKKSIQIIEEEAQRSADRKTFVFSDQSAPVIFQELFDKWKAAYNANDWKSILALLHSGDPDAEEWAKGKTTPAKIFTHLSERKKHGNIISSSPGALTVERNSAEQTFVCKFADGTSMEWRSMIMMDTDNLPKLNFPRLFPIQNINN